MNNRQEHNMTSICTAATMRRCRFAGFLILLPLAVVGCGSNSATVTGTVKYKGQPLPLGTVTIHGEKGEPVQGAIVDGSYQVDKAPVGPVKITVSVPKTPKTPGQMSMGGREGKEGPGMPGAGGPKNAVPIPDKYASPDTSGKSTTLSKGKQEYNIDLD
jgi:hypothetical protein